MYKAAVVLAIALVGRAAWAAAGADAVPATLLLRGEDLARARALVRAGDPGVAEPLAKLRLRAAKALAAPAVVLTDKRHPQPGLDPHDYVSLATYYWPDPTKPDGLPYVSRDGEQNPEIEEYDFATLGRMQRAVHNLAHAWYFTGERRYAERAARQLRAWFVDPMTRMNPNLRHAQMIRGKDTGRSGGIIDLYRLPVLLDDVRLLRGAPGWTDADEEGLRALTRSSAGAVQSGRLWHLWVKAQAREHFGSLRAHVGVECQECGVGVQRQRNVHRVIRPQASGTSHLG